MSLEELKTMFPDYHPEDYTMSITDCCGSCKKGESKIYFVLCHGMGSDLEMFPYGLCPQYERNTDIKMPVVSKWVKNNQFGNGQG